MTDLRRPDDKVLIAGALRGDEEALGRLLAQDQEWAYNVAYRVLGQEADARDAVQDAFLQTVRALRGDGSPPRSIETYRPWLRRVVSNAAITQIRRRPSATVASADDLADSVSGSADAEPGHSVEREETRAQVLLALLSLPETQRVALALRELLKASYDEIADALDLPRTAVGTLLFRARAGFRAAYDRASEGTPPVDCPDLVPLFSAIVDDEPLPAAWQELEDHLRTCERCQGDLEGQRRARRAYALLPLLALPVGWDPVAAAIQGLAGGATAGQPASAGAGASAAGASGASSAAAGSTAAGSAVGSGSTSGGLVASALSAKLTIAALATAAMVGVAAVAGPLAGLGSDSTPGPSPAPVLASAAPATPGPATTPTAGAISGSTAGTPLASDAPASTPLPALATMSALPAVATSPGPATAPQDTVAGATAAPLASPNAETPGSPLPLPAGSPSPTP